MYFIFLILQEMSIDSDTPEFKDISYKSQIVIFSIIILNIISSVVRFLGSIFMFILAKLFYKLKISKILSIFI